MRTPKSCAVACVKNLNARQKDQFVRAIDDEYTVHMIVDNLPVGRFVTNMDSDTLFSIERLTASMWILNHVFFTDLQLMIILQSFDDRFKGLVVYSFP